MQYFIHCGVTATLTTIFLLPGELAWANSECGTASYYDYEGSATASGEMFDGDAMTAAHAWLPLDTRVTVVNQETKETIVVRINDRTGPTTPHVIDLTPAGMMEIAPSLDVGIREVCLYWEEA
ncbi:MAG: septal ring lytic transglycosylase RlpA family protein [Elainellaceae cyanobacterium]